MVGCGASEGWIEDLLDLDSVVIKLLRLLVKGSRQKLDVADRCARIRLHELELAESRGDNEAVLAVQRAAFDDG